MTQHNGTHHNGKPSPHVRVAHDMSQVAHDVVELAELQMDLATIEFKGWWKKLLRPVVLLVVAGALIVGTIPVLLLAGAYVLAELVPMSMAGALAIVGCSGVCLAGVVVLLAWKLAQRAQSPFDQSKREFNRNLQWFKSSIRHGSHVREGVVRTDRSKQPS